MSGRSPCEPRWAQAILCICTLAQSWQYCMAFVLPEMPRMLCTRSLNDFKLSSSRSRCSQVLCPSSLRATHTAWPYLRAAKGLGTRPYAEWSSEVGRLRGGAHAALGAVDDSSSSNSDGGGGGTSSGTGKEPPAAVELPTTMNMRGGLLGLTEHDG